MAYNKIKHVEAAQKHLAQGRVPQAILEYQQILKHEPSDQVTLMTVGDLYVRAGETFQAIDYFARLAQIFIRDGFLTKAIAIYKKIAKLAPEEMKPLERLAELYVQQGVLSEARPIFLQLAEGHIKAGRREPAAALLRKLLEAEPDNLRVQMRLADVQLAMGQKADAAATLLVCAERQLVHHDPEEAIKLVKRALELSPDNFLAHLLMSRALSAAGKHSEAAAILESLPDVDSGNETAEQLLDLYLHDGRTDRAMELAKRILARDPKHYNMAGKTVSALLEAGQSDEALGLLEMIRNTMATSGDAEPLAQMLQRAVAGTPGRIEPHEWLVELYTQINDTFHLPDALAHLGQAAAAAGHFERARQVYEQLAEKSPEDENIRRNLEQVRAHLGLAPLTPAVETPVPTTPEPETPKQFVEPALDEETQHYVTLALTDVDLFSSYGLTPKAIDLLEQVIVRAPRHTPSLEKLLDLHLGDGNNERTAELSERLMQIHTERGDTANAERFAELYRRFRRAAALDPDSVTAAAPPAEFALPGPEPELDAGFQAPRADEEVEEITIISDEPLVHEADGVDESKKEMVHEVDLSDEWASISEQLEDAPEETAAASAQNENESQETELAEPAVVESNSSALNVEEAPSAPDVLSVPGPEPVHAASGGVSPVEESPVEYELELVETAPQPGATASVSPIRPAAEADGGALGDLALELGLVLDAAPPMAPNAPGNGTARLTPPPVDAPAQPKAPISYPTPSTPMVAASDPGGPLSEIFNEFRKELDELQTDEDPETHYNLGIAYREMGLLEEAISEFQKVVQAHDHGMAFRYTMQCCTLLALAFMEKGQPEIASFWYERALRTPDLDQESVLALQYDLGISQDLAGHADAALKSFQQVYAMNIDYRDVAERIGSLRQR